MTSLNVLKNACGMNLIIIHPEELKEGRATLTGARAEHIRSVLNAEPGQTLCIGLLNGPPGVGIVEGLEPVTLSCEWDADTPPRPAVDLLLALPRPKVLKRLWAQLAALGVGRIILANAEKVERYYFDSHVLQPDFYNARLIEGLQQARDTLLPYVRIVKELKPFMEDEFDALYPSARRFLADPSAEKTMVDAMSSPRSERILLAVGPEGGWTPYEIDLFKAHGFKAVGMGRRILRTDTACIALLTLVTEIHRA